MKKFISFAILLVLSYQVIAQRHSRHTAKMSASPKYYTLGVQYFKIGNYAMADSMFHRHLKRYSADKNAWFSLAVTQLYLKDTVDFCKNMLDLCNNNQDKEAGKFYFSICGTADTVFRDRKYQVCSPGKSRYMLVVETHKYHPDYKTVVVHKKGEKVMALSYGTGFSGSLKEVNVDAIYRLYPNGHRIFVVLLYGSPEFVKGKDAYDDYLSHSPDIEVTREEFKLKHNIAYVEYLLDSSGNVHNIKLTSMEKPIPAEQLVKLKKEIKTIILNQPEMKPAQYRHKNVNFLVESNIPF